MAYTVSDYLEYQASLFDKAAAENELARTSDIAQADDDNAIAQNLRSMRAALLQDIADGVFVGADRIAAVNAQCKKFLDDAVRLEAAAVDLLARSDTRPIFATKQRAAAAAIRGLI